MGGPSSEHEVSLKTGAQVSRSLDPAAYAVTDIVITKNGEWMMPRVPPQLLFAGTRSDYRRDVMQGMAVAMPQRRALEVLAQSPTDAVFIAMHGEFGEDGTIQSILEEAKIPYTGSDSAASRLAMDKAASTQCFADAGMAVAPFGVVIRASWLEHGVLIEQRIIGQFATPLVIKPNDRGSSVGVSIVEDSGKLHEALKFAFSFSGVVMVQKYIFGTEVTCGVVEDSNGSTYAFQPTEIVPREKQFFDYHSKYVPDASFEITPARLSFDINERIRECARIAHRSLGCSGMSRTDMIVDASGAPHILELNTIPGLTETSLLPRAVEAAGMKLGKFLDVIIAVALEKHAHMRLRR
jgi:D-alanine-D-alanine ligase